MDYALTKTLYRKMLRPLIPQHLRRYRWSKILKHEFKKAQRRFYRHLTHELGMVVTPVELGPPMSEQIAKVTAGFTADDSRRNAEYYRYFSLAFGMMLQFLRALERVGFNFRTVGSVLDFGCGSARFLRLLLCVDGLRLVGSDVNPDCVEWCRDNVPGPEFYNNDLKPPLSFASDASFDLALAGSVFTHIPLELQKPWLREIYRVLRPGGIFLCTVLGLRCQEKMLGPEDRERLESDGRLVLDAGNPAASFATQNAGSWDVFQTRSKIIDSFSSVFRVLDYQQFGMQDLLVLLKPGR